MPADTVVSMFDSSIQRTDEWLDDVMKELNIKNRRNAYRVLKATLQALRDRLTPQEALDLASQLPLLIRGSFFEGWDIPNVPLKISSKEEFLALIEEKLQPTGLDLGIWDTSELGLEFESEIEGIELEFIARGIFSILDRKISKGEIEDIKSNLPQDIKEIWPKKG